MSLRFQRLLLIMLTLVIILSAVLLILFNTKENVSYFYTPSEIDKSNIIINKIIAVEVIFLRIKARYIINYIKISFLNKKFLLNKTFYKKVYKNKKNFSKKF